MDIILLNKINTALTRASELDHIEERKMYLNNPLASLTNSEKTDLAVMDIPEDSGFVLLDQLNNHQKPIKLFICMKKNDVKNISLGVGEVINIKKWKSHFHASNYLKKRAEWVLASPHMKIGRNDCSINANPMFLNYNITNDLETIKDIAVLIDRIQTSVTKSARQFNVKS